MKKFKYIAVGPRSKRQRKQIAAIVLGLAVLMWGVATLVPHADTTRTASFQAESGTKSGVTTVTDATAAGGGAIRFGASTTPVENTFTFASIPDTQVEVGSVAGAQRYNNRLQWLANNKTALNLKYVWQVGDLQDWDDATHSHYVRASDGLKILEQAGIPYGLTVGNHDTGAVCTGGSACPGANTSLTFRSINTWHDYYPPSRFAGLKTLCSEFSTFNDRLMAAAPVGVATNNQNHPQFIKDRCAERNTTDNAYRTFTAGGLKWILINYEMWPRQPVQEWLKTVLERYPDHNAILFTHMHLNGDGSVAGDFGGYGSPQGTPQMVQNNVIAKFPNVRFTFSGHTGVAACSTFTGVNGNKIYSYLDNRREGASPPNHVRLIKIDVAARTATSQIYVPQDGQTLSQGSNCNISDITWIR